MRISNSRAIDYRRVSMTARRFDKRMFWVMNRDFMLSLWKQGLNTKDIAWVLSERTYHIVSESFVYNVLSKYRSEERLQVA